MLSPADDFLVHQTFEPIRFVGSSDRRYYDRYFFTGHNSDETMFFMLGMGCYPNLGVIDAFASVSIGDAQVTTRGSRELGHDRMNTRSVGSFDVEVVEGLRRIRFKSESTDHPIRFNLLWEGAVPAFEEPPLFQRREGRMIEQGIRFIQTGTWTGYMEVDGSRCDLDGVSSMGARDHAWGVRSIGFEREPKGILQAKKLNEARTPLWIWAPMQFDDYTIHYSLSEYASGEREICHVRKISSFDNGGTIEDLSDAEHDLIFDPVTRELQAGSKVSFTDSDGAKRTVTMYPMRRAYLRAGTGYGGPEPWRHGKYMGEHWEDSVRFDLNDQEVTGLIGPTHVLCRMEMDNGKVGYGTFETQVYGAFPRYGFTS
ncbi:MAG: hypothetical protein AB7G25_02605 [Sphingomonadaceae bacterium]